MTDDESALYQRAQRLGYNVRRMDGEYSLNGRIHWLRAWAAPTSNAFTGGLTR
jgi:hypothetical protein